jgi:Na+/pantothenate symporter
MIPVAAVPAWFALDPPADVVPLTAFSGALFGGFFFPALVIGLWWKQPGSRAVVASIVAGAAGVLGWSLGLQEALDLRVIHPVFAGLLASIVVYGVVGVLSRPPAEVRS